MQKSFKHLTTVSFILIVIGVICFITERLLLSFVDKASLLHEAFFLIPLGYLFIILGLILLFIPMFKQNMSA